jgi:hypothetical protein
MDPNQVIFDACVAASKDSVKAFALYLQNQGVHVSNDSLEGFITRFFDGEQQLEEVKQPEPVQEKKPTRVRVKKQRIQPNTMAHADVLGPEDYVV